ncbi:cytochrome P450 [Nocardia sp. NPDC050718]|uniref:cytochrome P450 n=1 Tax=unclassified Nocardia TaxID=2637762 RepID=UPI00340F8437
MSVRHIESVRALADNRYLVTGYDAALQLLADRRMSNDPANGADRHADIAAQPAATQRHSTSMQMCDGARHTRLRRAVAPTLTPRRYDDPVERMRGRATGLLDALLARGGGDLVAEFVLPLVFSVICDLLGVPDADRDRVLAWAEASTMPDPEVSEPGTAALDTYLAALLATKGEQPTDDLSSELAASRAAGLLSDAEAVGTAALMIVAGYETTVSFVSMSVFTLLMAPRLQCALARRPESLPTAVEELFRYLTPTQGTWTRFALDDVPIGDIVIPAGSAVVVDLVAANRDPDRFDHPDRLDPTRADTKHLAFGHGPHYCPGATLARKQAQVLLGVLLPRLSELRLAVPVTEVRWHRNRFSKRPGALPTTVLDSRPEAIA